MTRLLLVILLLMALTACAKKDDANPTAVAEMATTVTAQPAPVDTATAPPTATSRPTPASTLTPSPMPTDTPAPTPTITPIPTHTATPMTENEASGYLRNELAGFALSYPEEWVILDDPSVDIVVHDDDSGMVFSMSSLPVSELPSFAEFTGQVLAVAGEGYAVLESDELVLGADTPAERALLGQNGEDPLAAVFEIVYAQNGDRAYAIVSGAQGFVYAIQGDELNDIYASMAFFEPGLYGLDRSETVVQLAMEPSPQELDPALQIASADGAIGLLYSGLVRLSPELAVEPDLAQSWEISPDGLQYTFTLRPDLAFANGRPLTAHDVQYSWERATDPATGSGVAATYLGDIVGVNEKLAGAAEQIAGVEVVNDQTLVVTLDGPKPYFLAKLTYPTSYVVAREDIATDPEGWMFNPNSSGPFRLAEFRSGEAMIFERNDNYYAPAEIRNVVLRINVGGTPISLFQSGDIDIAPVALEQLHGIAEEDPIHEQVHTTTELCTSFVQLNTSRPPLDDVNVRRALYLATDRERVNNVYGEGFDTLAETLLPPSMPGYLPQVAGLGYDPEAARAALAASDYADGLPEIRLSTSGSGGFESLTALTLADMWRTELGVDVVIEYYDQLTYVTAAKELESNAIQRGWCADYPDPENFLDILAHSESDLNLVEYASPELDKLVEQARAEQDLERRLALYAEAEQVLQSDVGIIPLGHSISRWLVSPRLLNYVSPPIGVAQMHRVILTELPAEETPVSPVNTAGAAATPTATGSPTTAGLTEIAITVVNNTDSDICFLYSSFSTDDTWGPNRLLLAPIEPGGQYTIPLPEGEYDFLAQDCESEVLGLTFQPDDIGRLPLDG